MHITPSHCKLYSLFIFMLLVFCLFVCFFQFPVLHSGWSILSSANMILNWSIEFLILLILFFGPRISIWRVFSVVSLFMISSSVLKFSTLAFIFQSFILLGNWLEHSCNDSITLYCFPFEYFCIFSPCH